MSSMTPVLLDYRSAAAEIDSAAVKFYRMRTFFVFIRVVETWIICVVLVGPLLHASPRYGLGDNAKWGLAAVGTAFSLPYWALVRMVVYRRCYPSRTLFVQALILCINYGFALGETVRMAALPCGCW